MKIILACFTILFFSLNLFAGKGKSIYWSPDTTWNPSSRYGKLYNTKSVEKVSGEIIDVEEIKPFSGMGAGIHLKLKTSKETIPIHLGPAWYILNQNVTLSEGDWITVKGSRIMFSKERPIVAAQIQKKNKFMQLRDKKGTPYWCSDCIPRSEKF